MKTTERFDNAVTKLYNAFHENRLIGMDCAACAVGNICNNNAEWRHIESLSYSRSNKNYIDKYNILNSGYSAKELRRIEMIFLFGYSDLRKFGEFRNVDIDKDQQFKGLCAVVEYICELDNIPNVMDYTKLFETENDKPKYQLS